MTDTNILSETKEIVQKLNKLDEYFDSLAEKTKRDGLQTVRLISLHRK